MLKFNLMCLKIGGLICKQNPEFSRKYLYLQIVKWLMRVKLIGYRVAFRSFVGLIVLILKGQVRFQL